MALAVLIFNEGFGIGFASIDTAKIWGGGQVPPSRPSSTGPVWSHWASCIPQTSEVKTQ